jgi:serine/threonine protein kinase/WD40 repeat protein
MSSPRREDERLDEEFSDAWSHHGTGAPPSAADFLANHPDASPAERVDVLLADQLLRWQRGCPKLIGDYLAEQSDLVGYPEAILMLVQGEFLARLERDEAPEPGSYMRMFPDLAEEIRLQCEVDHWLTIPSPQGRSMAPTVDYHPDDTDDRGEGGREADECNRRPSMQERMADQDAPLRDSDFQLVRRLGSGGMGEVYEAIQQSLRKRVALKLIKREALDSPSRVRRFLSEARTLARLRHPHIVGVHGIGRMADGRYFLVMDLVEGGTTLAASARGGMLPLDRAAGLVATVAEAIEHAHSRGVIHRDLKPSNVLLDGEGNAHVTDFGLAKVFDAADPDHPQTTVDQILGTPHYMAPEQADPARGPVTPRTDVYALGGLLYALATGQPPIQGETLTALLTQVVSPEPVPSPRAFRADVPTALERICLTCLTKDAGKRYASAREVAEALRSWLASWGPADVGADPVAPGSPKDEAAAAMTTAIPDRGSRGDWARDRSLKEERRPPNPDRWAARSGLAPRSGRRLLLAGSSATMLLLALVLGAKTLWLRPGVVPTGSLRPLTSAPPEPRPGSREDLAATPPAQPAPAEAIVKKPDRPRPDRDAFPTAPGRLVSGPSSGQLHRRWELLAASPARRPEVWAIVVGIGDYRHPAIPDSRTAEQDAQGVRQWLRRAGWDDRHQLLLTDSGSSDPGDPRAPAPNLRPVRTNLDWAFRRWLPARAEPGDLVVFYFAGRSRAVVKPQEARLDPRVDYYLLPSDAAAENPELTGWSLDRAVDACARRRLQVVCWLATAVEEQRAGPPPVPGGLATSRAVAESIRPRPSVSTGADWLARLARWPGVTAWLASDRPGGPRAADPGSSFTQALLEALGPPDPRRRRKPNLAACLRELRQHPRLQLQGFCSDGEVSPSLTLWAAEVGQPSTPELALVSQVGHGDKVTALVSPADGHLVVTASLDSTVRVWSARDRSLLRVLPGETLESSEVATTDLALTRDERWLISGGGRGAIRVYDRERDFAPKLVAEGQPHDRRIVRIALLPDGIHFITIDREGQSALWDPRESPLAPRPWVVGTECHEVVCGGKLDPDGDDTGVVIARCGDGKVRAFDSAGGGGTVLEFPRGRPTALAVSPDGRRLAAGFDDGLVIGRELQSRQPRGARRLATLGRPVVDVGAFQALRQAEYRAADRPVAVGRLAFSPAGRLAIGHGRGARLVTITPTGLLGDASKAPAAQTFDLTDQPVQSLNFSPDGEYLAACIENSGALRVWRIGADGPPRMILDDGTAKAALLSFTGDGRDLISGEFDGAVSFRPLAPRGDEAAWTFPANRGKLRHLSATASRRALLLLDEQRRARIWDLRDRTCRRLQGAWSAGEFLDDDHLVLIADSGSIDLAGRLVRFDRDKLGSDPAFFASQAGPFRMPDSPAWARLALSPDRTRIAAASDASKEPMVGVWETKTGRLSHWMTSARLEGAAIALSFSSDARYLLTGGDSPTARIWDLSAQGELGAPAVRFSDPAVRQIITCAAIRPGHADQVVTGHSDGRVHVWRWSGAQARLEVPQLITGTFAGAVKSVRFTSDGQHLAAAGDGTRIWVGTMEPQPHSIETLDRLRPHHLEPINALATWPGRPILISGSDDATVRIWDLGSGALRGTFAAATRPSVSDAAAVQDLDWVFFTPDGTFDATATADRLVRFRRQDRPQWLDQFEGTHRAFRLGEDLVEGRNPQPTRHPGEPPPVALSRAPRSDPSLPEARLTIALGAAELEDVRLYHNDVPIPAGRDSGGPWRPEELDREIVVRLAPNRNRFYVMASRAGAYDNRSNVVEVDYHGPSEPGQVHVLALGVGDYNRRRLPHVRRDAEQLSEVLHRRGLGSAGRRGLQQVLADDAVSRENVERAFDELARRVEDRPQDTVVVFLAGRADIFDHQGLCLLLPDYPFPEGKPSPVAGRRMAGDAGEAVQVDPRFVLPFSVLVQNLARLRALNRLLIVDAYPAESSLEAAKIGAIRRWVDGSSRRAGASSLVAASPGEPPLELDPLGHGLFAYALLRGLGTIPVGSEPREITELGLPRDADFDGDGVLSTGELDAYAAQVVPRLADVYPRLVAGRRGPAAGRDAAGPLPPISRLEPKPQVRGAGMSFPLVPLGEGR